MRIDHARPKVVMSASCGIEPARVVEYKPLLDSALEQATHRPDRCVILQRPQCVAGLAEGATWTGRRPYAAPSRPSA